MGVMIYRRRISGRRALCRHVRRSAQSLFKSGVQVPKTVYAALNPAATLIPDRLRRS